MNDATILLSLSLVLGHAVSWALDNVKFIKAWFDNLDSVKKLGLIVALCVLAGVVNVGLGAELAESLLVVTFSLLGSQVSHLQRKSGAK